MTSGQFWIDPIKLTSWSIYNVETADICRGVLDPFVGLEYLINIDLANVLTRH